MKIEVLFFAGAREAVGDQAVDIDLPAGTTVEGLLHHLIRVYPRFAQVANTAQTAVNQEYAPPTQFLKEGDEVAIIPPVSGGIS